ncbi:MAG: glutamine--tRNA ligase/YqeY domain fusion protein [Bacteroidota bacterium]
MPAALPDAPARSSFIHDQIEDDLAAGKTEVVVRFPPEPNGYLHLGHVKSMCLNFGLARDYAARAVTRCHLRFDDTNPETEDIEYVRAIQRDVRWLGFDWGAHLYHASDYFEQLYDWARQLIRDGKAYVDSQDLDAIRANRGTVTEPGTPSPYRTRTVQENLDLFERMRAGDFPDGAHVLRAKVDPQPGDAWPVMGHPNMKLRDPVMYRIRHAAHYRRGDAWPIYPLYDWAHGQSDAIEGITHSLCTLEFDVNRPLYDWYLDALGFEAGARPHQYEFARGNVDYTVMSKRKLRTLVREGHVAGWDDPRMPTVAALRRRGVTPEALRAFWESAGITKTNSRAEMAQLEYAIRDDLNTRAPRVLAVLDPLTVTVTNWPENEVDYLHGDYWPRDIDREGSRPVPFGRTLLIERDDFEETPPKDYYRLAPGRAVRLRHAYVLRCDEVVKDAAGEVVELKCTYFPRDEHGHDTSGLNPKGTIHWVTADHAVEAEVRLYDRLFRVPDPDDVPEGGSFLDHLNPDSLRVVTGYLEPSLRTAQVGDRFQFERQGYFVVDEDSIAEDSTKGALVFNRTVTLRDSWGSEEEATTGESAEAKAARKERQRQLEAERGDPVEALDADARMAYNRYEGLGVSQGDALLLAQDSLLATFFDAALAAHGDAAAVAPWVTNEVQRVRKDTPLADLKFAAADLAALVALVDDGTLSNRAAKQVLDAMAETGDAPAVIVEREGLRQVSDVDTLAPVIAEVLGRFPDKVAAYQGGKTKLIGFFVGQTMRATGGSANPALVKALLVEALS